MPRRRRKRSARSRRKQIAWIVSAGVLLLAILALGSFFLRPKPAAAPDIVARVLFSETANCTPQERLLVAGVMQNRIGNPPFGHAVTLQEVVTHPGAFSCINDDANANWRKSAHPEQMSAAERAVWQQCLDCLSRAIPPALGPSGRLLVYYHDKSITKPRGWDNAQWHAIRELETSHFIFYSILPAHPAANWFPPRP